VINWTGDVRQPIPDWYIEVGKACSLSLFTNDKDIEVCNENGVKADYLQIGYNEHQYNEISMPEYMNQIKPKDVVFMANHYQYSGFPLTECRMKVANELLNTFGERFALYGSGWQENLPQVGSLMFNQHLEAEVYRNSKMAINLSHFNLSRYSSDRLLRIMACGCLCLSHKYDNIGMEYENKKHLVYWSSIEELKELIEYYSKPENESERKKIAEAGRKLVQENCNWTKRVEQLKQLIVK
jgi:hypothetical protein